MSELYAPIVAGPIRRQNNLVLQLIQQPSGNIQLVGLHLALADRGPHRFQKRVRHRPADQELVDSLAQVLDDGDLV
jgi:hypothetical protein